MWHVAQTQQPSGLVGSEVLVGSEQEAEGGSLHYPEQRAEGGNMHKLEQQAVGGGLQQPGSDGIGYGQGLPCARKGVSAGQHSEGWELMSHETCQLQDGEFMEDFPSNASEPFSSQQPAPPGSSPCPAQGRTHPSEQQDASAAATATTAAAAVAPLCPPPPACHPRSEFSNC